MANTKISALPNASAVVGTEEIAVVQSGATVRMSVDDMIQPRYGWWYSAVDQVIADSTWTPIDWVIPQVDNGSLHLGLVGATTIAAGSNGAALPQATINVASTASFRSSGWINVTLADGKQRVISYTGKTGTSFTGCALGVGSLATGQVVAEANCEMDHDGRLMAMIAQAQFEANATGGRAIRIRNMDLPYQLVGATTGPHAPVSGQVCNVQVAMQAGSAAGVYNLIEVWQNSGGALTCKNDGIQAPSLMFSPLGKFP